MEPGRWDQAFEAMARDQVGALALLESPTILTNRTRLVELAAKYRLPAMYGTRELVDAGGLMSYGPNAADRPDPGPHAPPVPPDPRRRSHPVDPGVYRTGHIDSIRPLA